MAPRSLLVVFALLIFGRVSLGGNPSVEKPIERADEICKSYPEGSLDFLDTFGLKDLPDHVMPTGDDFDNPAYIMSPAGVHQRAGVVVCPKGLQKEFSLLTKFRLDDTPHSFTLFNISSDSGDVDLAISIDASSEPSVTFECSSVIAKFELDSFALEEKVWYKMAFLITTSRIVLTANNKVLGEGMLSDVDACQFRCEEKNIHITQNLKHPVHIQQLTIIPNTHAALNHDSYSLDGCTKSRSRRQAGTISPDSSGFNPNVSILFLSSFTLIFCNIYPFICVYFCRVH
jgi:hypothetical protein